MVEFRRFDPRRDRAALRRILREVGWLEEGKDEEEAADAWMDTGHLFVADPGRGAECFAGNAPGTIRYQDTVLPFSALTGVATSRTARRQGYARRLTAHCVADAGASGAAVMGMTVFDQGFYNALGFGACGYQHEVAFDPFDIAVERRPRPPERLSADDWEELHAARLIRRSHHGLVCMEPAAGTRYDLVTTDNGFGLGYRDVPGGRLSHFIWFEAEDVEEAPYHCYITAFATLDQFLELLGLLKGLSDQVSQVVMTDPPGIHLQDLLARPLRGQRLTRGSEHPAGVKASSHWQMRVCDVAACLAATRLPGSDVRFNLRLRDPLERHLPPDAPWRGVSGDYTVRLGEPSSAAAGHTADLPLLDVSVPAFTRLWLGILPASTLAITDDLSAPPALLAALDRAIVLPPLMPDWEL